MILVFKKLEFLLMEDLLSLNGNLLRLFYSVLLEVFYY